MFEFKNEEDYMKLYLFKDHLDKHFNSKEGLLIKLSFVSLEDFQPIHQLITILKRYMFECERINNQFIIQYKKNSEIDMLFKKFFYQNITEEFPMFPDYTCLKISGNIRDVRKKKYKKNIAKYKISSNDGIFQFQSLIPVKYYRRKSEIVGEIGTKLLEELEENVEIPEKTKRNILEGYNELVNNSLYHSKTDCYFSLLIFSYENHQWVYFSAYDISDIFFYTSIKEILDFKSSDVNEVTELYKYIVPYESISTIEEQTTFCTKLCYKRGVTSKVVDRRKWGKGIDKVNQANIKQIEYLPQQKFNSFRVLSGHVHTQQVFDLADPEPKVLFNSNIFDGTLTTVCILEEE